VTRKNALGEYLRARREQTTPADAGIQVIGVRRTPGLRREEVATLAGISADYYLRLEQGRDRNPSAQVLLSLSREKLPIGESGGQLLVVYHAEPGSDSARSLALLGSLAATEQAQAGQPVGE
jgi:transcriptional regulator with XRE-family HTH domain